MHCCRQQSTIMNILCRFQQTGNVSDLLRQRITTLLDDHDIRLIISERGFRSAPVTARNTVGAHGHSISDQTVRNRDSATQTICWTDS